MNLLGTEYNLKHRAFEIYLSGCKAPHCKGCHSKDSWDFNAGEPIVIEELCNKIKKHSYYINSIWLMGGEPTHQNYNELVYLLDKLSTLNKDMWLWTRYDIKDIDKDILNYFDYIKSGKYDEALPGYDTDYGIYLASNNQRIYSRKEFKLNETL